MGKWTRRAFITTGVVTGGALVVGVAIRPGHRVPKLSPLVAHGDETLVNAWVKLSGDNQITAIVPHSEMGQGVHTSLPMMLADEMDADWSMVQMMEAPAHEEYANYALGRGYIMGNMDVPKALVGTVNGAFLKLTQQMNLQITGGSTAIRTTGIHGMRIAGAAAREMLLKAAADTWQVPIGELTAANSQIRHEKSDRTAPYAAFAVAAAEMTPPAKPRLKKPEEYTIQGTSRARLDVPAKVDGSAQFGIDAMLPGMKVATVMAAPIFGHQVLSVDSSKAENMPGVSKIVNLDNAVAVVADGYWQALQALKALQVTFAASSVEDGSSRVSQADIFDQFARDMDAAVANGEEQSDWDAGDVESAVAAASNVVEAEYRVPYLAHACMEPMNCTVSISSGQCEVWTGCQNPLGFRASVAEAIGFAPENVTVHNAYLGGGFGRRSNPDFAIQAARVAQATGAPVKLIWSREEDVRHDHYRPAILSRFRASLDETGNPTSWENQYVDKHEPAEAPHIPYAIDNQHIHWAESPTHIPFGPWRSVDHSQHGFFTESFMDELAFAAGKDPYHYRRDQLSKATRYRDVLDLAAKKAGWDVSLKTKGKDSTSQAKRGRGIALQHSFETIVAQVVEVTVDEGKVKVDRVVCAVDPGFAINPDGLIAQMESGIIYGLTAALYGEISIEQGAVVQSNFHDYEMLRIDETPVIETYIINSGADLGGAGEPGTPAIAPALANAVFDAIGTRVRELPLKKYDLRFSIEEREVV